MPSPIVIRRRHRNTDGCAGDFETIDTADLPTSIDVVSNDPSRELTKTLTFFVCCIDCYRLERFTKHNARPGGASAGILSALSGSDHDSVGFAITTCRECLKPSTPRGAEDIASHWAKHPISAKLLESTGAYRYVRRSAEGNAVVPLGRNGTFYRSLGEINDALDKDTRINSFEEMSDTEGDARFEELSYLRGGLF